MTPFAWNQTWPPWFSPISGNMTRISCDSWNRILFIRSLSAYPPHKHKLVCRQSQVAFMSYRVVFKDERPTSNVQRRTSNNDVAPLRNLISFVFINPKSNPERLFYIDRIPSNPWFHHSTIPSLHYSNWGEAPNFFFYFFIFFHSTFDVGRSMFDVRFFSYPSSPLAEK